MPTVSVDALEFYAAVADSLKLDVNNFEKEKFIKALDDVAFQFGVEYDGWEDTPEAASSSASDLPVATGPRIKIEVGANRYDLLCMEGLAYAINQYLRPDKFLNQPFRWTVKEPSVTLTVHGSVSKIRAYCTAAIFRGVKFTPKSFLGFIGLQDKLHQNLGRQRSISSIGTHDYGKLKGPFHYKALPKKNGFKFEPLKNQGKMVDGEGMFELLKDGYLKPYLPIIQDFDLTPIICQGDNEVISVPPIINANHCKMTLETTDIFVEVTATDYRKANIFLDVVTAFMADKTKEPYTVEPVKIVYAEDHPGIMDRRATPPKMIKELSTPDLKPRKFTLSLEYARWITGIRSLTAEMCVKELLPKMGLSAEIADKEGTSLIVSCPLTRRDVLDPCDIVEDLAIAYGYTNVEEKEHSHVVKLQSLANVAERVRRVLAMAGWKEALTFGLVSVRDCFQDLKRDQDAYGAAADKKDPSTELYPDGYRIIRVSHPKAKEFECVRPTLIPGVLKTLSSNQAAEMPIKIFEVGDVVMQSKTNDTGTLAHQSRNVAAIVADTNRSGLEDVHGLLDKLLYGMQCRAEYDPDLKAICKPETMVYYLKPITKATSLAANTFLTGRVVAIMMYRYGDERKSAKQVGIMGTVHPEVLINYGLSCPCSLFELSVPALMNGLPEMDRSQP